jgi:plastocyanin
MTVSTPHRDHAAGTEALSPHSRDGVPLGIAVVLVGVAGIMAAYGEFFPDAAAISVVLAGLAIWATRNPSRRLRVAIALLLAIFVAINLAYAIGDLSHPESPAAFLATALVVGAGLVTIVLAVLSARGRPAPARRVWTIAGGAFVLLAAASGLAAAAVDNDDRLPGDIEIVARNAAFPAEATVDAEATGLFVRNEDRFRHTLVIEGQVAAVELPAATDVRIPVDLEPGTHRYYCDIVGHESMEGTLVVA